jgi:hypothetical protein
MSKRDASRARVDADAEGFPKRSGFPDTRAFVLAALALLDALMPTTDDATREVRACRT